ncbi:MAG: hypothetical protein ACK528_03865 [Alphaproteobacteria bacterium]
MNAHKNARTTPYVRELIAVRRREGWPVSEIAASFLERALKWMRARHIGVERIMTDKGLAYRSKLFAATLR